MLNLLFSFGRRGQCGQPPDIDDDAEAHCEFHFMAWIPLLPSSVSPLLQGTPAYVQDFSCASVPLPLLYWAKLR